MFQTENVSNSMGIKHKAQWANEEMNYFCVFPYWGSPPGSENFARPPPPPQTAVCPCFLTKACAPQLSFVRENF